MTASRKISTNKKPARVGFKKETMLLILMANKVSERRLPWEKSLSWGCLSEHVCPIRTKNKRFSKFSEWKKKDDHEGLTDEGLAKCHISQIKKNTVTAGSVLANVSMI